jgi:hypothetical protein
MLYNFKTTYPSGFQCVRHGFSEKVIKILMERYENQDCEINIFNEYGNNVTAGFYYDKEKEKDGRQII